MKYRSRTDITAQILEAANGSSTKTKIMYKAFLSYAQLKDYLSVLVENALLEYDSGEQTYRTTDKGNKFMQVYTQIGEFVTPVKEASSSFPSSHPNTHIRRKTKSPSSSSVSW